MWDFPGGPVVKNPPANAGDIGLIPGLGGSHMPRGNQARGVPTTAAHAPRACATATRSPAHHNQRAAAPPPHTATRESPHAAKTQQARDRDTTTIKPFHYGTATLENNLAISSKVKHGVTI